MEITYMSIVTGQVIKPSTYWMLQATRYNEHTTASEKEEFLAMYGVSALRVWIAMNPETEWKEQTTAVSEESVIKPKLIVSELFLSAQPVDEAPPVIAPQPFVIEERLEIQAVLEQPSVEPYAKSVEEIEKYPSQKRKGILAALSVPFTRKKREEVEESAEHGTAFIKGQITEATTETSLQVQMDSPLPEAPIDHLTTELNDQTHIEPDQQEPPAPSLRPLDELKIPMPPKRPKAIQSVPAPPVRPLTVRGNSIPPLRPKKADEVAKSGRSTPVSAANLYSKEDLWRMAKTDPYYDETATEDNGVVIRESRFNLKLTLVVIACLIVVVGGAISIALILSR